MRIKTLLTEGMSVVLLAGAAWGLLLLPEPATAEGSTLCNVYAQADYDESPYMQEDESPYRGLHGGLLLDYYEGVARYDDGTASDGTCWYTQESTPELFT